MKATEFNFLKLLDGSKQFIIPIYQRTYSWRTSDCQQLLSDILRVAQNDHIPSHFIGSIVYVAKDIFHAASVTEMLVIDGQQRLTTLFLLLAALAEALEMQRNEQAAAITPKKLRNQYLFNINEDEESEKYYKLLLTQSDRETLNAILERREEPATVALRIKENYRFFREQISQLDPETLFKGIGKLVIVDIALQQQDNPQLIFESLNSTGMDLSQADLIRNYVLMGLENADQVKLYKKYWYPMEQSFGQTQNVALFNRFIRDFLTLHTGDIPNVDKVYATFKAYHQDKTHIPIEQIIAEIHRYSKYFTCMVLAREKDAELKRCFEDIKTLEVNVVYPFLLEIYADYEQQRLSHGDFVAILKLIESYVFRRTICGMYTNVLNKVFATLAKEIDKEHYLESVQAIFLQRSAGARFPRDEEFQAAFMVKDIYNFRNRHYLFNKLENYGRNVLINIDDYTIEHLLPQNKNLSPEWQAELGSNWQEIQARYLHTIGNLTLTGPSYNSGMRDRPFREKRQIHFGLTQSGLQLNAGLESLDHWNAEEIEKRARVLATVATEIWSIPKLSAEQLSKYGPHMQRVPLIEVIGPVEHPLAGFVPAGYKIVPLNEKKFHYYGLVAGEWIPYGNGKVAWYTGSWGNAGKYLRGHAKKNEKPLGAGGEIHPRYAKAANGDPSASDQNGDDADDQIVYTLEHYAYLRGSTIRTLFENLSRRILNLDPSVREEYTKLYIAYKMTTNFVDIEPQKNRLRLFLNMSFSEIDDPKNLCRDVTAIGHHGNGDIEVRLSSLDQLDDAMELIRQAFEKHWEGEIA
ncbi:MAG TPA: DUF262 and DUF1524 domain-containing protein [Ktedonobacteraceae bacterium]|nr:DUF262 and DUF1524 domain-containing protein [Ktedonobacteraceae bacterium]